ncbi:MAG: DUF5009 domain-containing protein [Ferruginibacter sp.]|nr:DUF5009 domain-containing protein [Ferruginibacter sp.]
MKNRYLSLDVFRGATVALMILVNNPGSFTEMYSPLAHAHWEGCTFADLVFPFFLFAVGNAMAFALPSLKEKSRTVFFVKIFKRAIIIFIIGLLLNWSPFVKWEHDQLIFKAWQNVRIFGVLQRIAICYFFASLLIYFFDGIKLLLISLFLLALYWLMCYSLGEGSAPYSLEGFFGTNIDIQLVGLDHIYKGNKIPFDPEGLVSTLPAITQVIFGYIAGRIIISKGKNYAMITRLNFIGMLLIAAGAIWALFFPLIKNIWSSSYVIYTTGIAVVVICILIFLIELKNLKGAATTFFDVFGKNALFIFVISGLLPRVLNIIRIDAGVNDKGEKIFLSPQGWMYKYVLRGISENPQFGSFLYSLLFLMLFWTIGYVLYRKKIYIKV